MKQLYLFFLAFSISSISFGQGPQMTLGEPNSTMDYIPVELLGQTGDKYVMLTWVPALTLSSVLSGSYTSIKDLKIALLDASSMKREKLMAFPSFKGESIERTGNIAIEGTILNGDTLNVITSAWDKDERDYAIHIWQLNALTMEPFTPKARLIARLEDNGNDTYDRATVSKLEFTNQIALIYSDYRKKTKETTIFVHTFDKNLKELRKEKVVIGNSKYGTGIRDIDVDKNGNLYFINAVSTKQFPNWDDDRWIRVTQVPASIDEVTSVDIELKNGDPINGELVVSPTGEIFVAGHYSKMIDPKDGGKEFFGGSYIVQINPVSGQILKSDEKELTDNQKVSLSCRSLNPNMPERTRLREMNAMKTFKVDVDDFGNITLVGYAQYYVKTKSGSSQRISYYANSILVSNFKKDGTVNWQSLVPRSAFLNEMPYGLAPLIIRNSGNTHIIFNDENDNIEPLSMLASGKKVNGKSSSSSKEFEPKDYEPTDTDSPVKIESWNLKGTAIRHTVIDANGMWKINWLNPTIDNPDKKIPMIDGDILRQINSNNSEYITSCFTKYSMFGLQKSALLRLKF